MSIDLSIDFLVLDQIHKGHFEKPCEVIQGAIPHKSGSLDRNGMFFDLGFILTNIFYIINNIVSGYNRVELTHSDTSPVFF